MKKPIILKQVNPKVQQQAITALRLAIRLLEAQQNCEISGKENR